MIFRSRQRLKSVWAGLLLCSTLSAVQVFAGIEAGSKVLFLGRNAQRHKECFESLYSGSSELSDLSMNLTFDYFQADKIDQAYYTGRAVPTDTNDLISKLSEGFDCIVYLGKDDWVMNYPELHMQAVRIIWNYARKHGARIVLPMLWDTSDAVTHTSTFEEHTYRIADALEIDCVPAGLVWKDVLQDGTISVGQSSSVNTPSDEAEYTMAACLFSQFFERPATNSTYSHGSISAAVRTAISAHAYSTWQTAAAATHYTGEFTNSFCSPWTTPHDLGNRNWAAMGTSTEWGTGEQLEKIINNAGYPNDGYNLLNGYTYGYFPGNLDDTNVQAIVAAKNFDFSFGRHAGGDYAVHLAKLRTYDPGADGTFIDFQRHYSQDPNGTLASAEYWTRIVVETAHNVDGVWGIPNHIGFERIWEEDYSLYVTHIVQLVDQHLGSAGTYMQAAMIYAVITGNNAADTAVYTAEEEYAMNLGYQTVIELGGLKQAPGEVYADPADALPTIHAESGYYSNITQTSITVNATLTTTGDAPATVTLYWGADNPGQTAVGWDQNQSFSTHSGVVPAGYTAELAGLLPDSESYYVFKVVNSNGTNWSDVVAFSTIDYPGVAVNTTAGAINILPGVSRLRGELFEDPADLTVYWGTVDGVTNHTAWAYTNVMSGMSAGAFQYDAGGLTGGVTHYYRCFASNTVTHASGWASVTRSFVPNDELLAVDNGSGAVNSDPGVESMRGSLSGWPADVTIFWGRTDGGTNGASWQNTVSLAGMPVGNFSSTVSNLLYGMKYYYRCYASNSVAEVWAPASTSFTNMWFTNVLWSGGWGKVDDREAAIEFTGGWLTWDGNPGHLATESYSENTGDMASFTFTGSRARYYGFTRNDLGYAEIFIDGVSQSTVDCYSATAQFDVLLYETPLLTETNHTLTVRVHGTKNASSSGTEVIVDAFAWLPVAYVTVSHSVPYEWLEGHAVSKDMIHWEQLPHAILPYTSGSGKNGVIWSGSAVVDHNNSLGKQIGDTKMIVAFFTHTAGPMEQCAAYSTDRGRTFKLINKGDAVVPNQGIWKGERDPKVFWHAETKKWVMAVIVGGPDKLVRTWHSDDLVTWKKAGDFSRSFVECFDMYQLPVLDEEGNPPSPRLRRTRWVANDAAFFYQIGDFDGSVFTSDNRMLTGDWGGRRFFKAFYAGQTFNNTPDGKVYQIAWMKDAGKNNPFKRFELPFTQQMTFPCELTLRTTAEGVRLFRWPIEGIKDLYKKSHEFKSLSTVSKANKFVSGIKADLVDMSTEFEPVGDAIITFKIRGLDVVYGNSTKFPNKDGEMVAVKSIEFNNIEDDRAVIKIPAPTVDGKVSLRILLDRISIEMFVNGGAYAATSYCIPITDNIEFDVSKGDELKINSLVVHELESIWK